MAGSYKMKALDANAIRELTQKLKEQGDISVEEADAIYPKKNITSFELKSAMEEWYEVVTVKAGNDLAPEALKAVGRKRIFDGWERFLKAEQPKALGEYRKGQKLEGELSIVKSFTTPPPRYDDGSFIKALESNGVGRPSTYAAIQSTLFKRNYVRKEKGKYVLTDLGRKVLEWAKERFPEIADVGFTARLEDMLDAVETGEESWENVVRQVDEIIKKKLDQEMTMTR